MPGATVCRRHGGSAPAVQRNAEQLVALREFHVSLPFLQKWTDQLVAEYRRGTEGLADGDRPRRCRARRKNGERCKAWAIRGGFVCRAHGGAAPQVRAKAQQRARAAEIYREVVAKRQRRADPSRTRA